MSDFMDPEYPPKADLRLLSKPLPKVPPGTIDPTSIDSDATILYATSAIASLNDALESKNLELLSACFYEQAYWRDIVALTSHLRTINSPRAVAGALLQTVNMRGLDESIGMTGIPQFVMMNPAMMFIDCSIAFYTRSPALRCAGKLILLPVNIGSQLDWKIWVISTWVEELVGFPENTDLLSLPGLPFNYHEAIEKDVCIIGAGTSGLMTASRLKALGVESIVLDRNPKIGDSWAKRYDSLKFHVPTSNCEMPYMSYGREFQTPQRLSKDDVANHLQQYAETFHLNIVAGSIIQTTVFDVERQVWTLEVTVEGRENPVTVVCKHLVQATGLGSSKPNFPILSDESSYQGLCIHSVHFRNTQQLIDRDAKSVVIIGSGNTAFDVMQDCWKAGLRTTMIVRSPTYIFPYDYVMDSHEIGAYDTMPLEAADRKLNTFPSMLDGQFSHGLFAHLASKEPDRYEGLRKVGFPVLDSSDHSVNVLHHLFERGGGHYIDVGGTNLLAEGKVSVRGLVEPVAYTESGLRLSDDSVIDADVVIWCTGFADLNIKETVQEVLGTGKSPHEGEHTLSVEEIASRLDASWGVDVEGEVRGVWKRHLNMENYWVIGGTIQHQRWWSRAMVQQIKLALEGTLPPAYRVQLAL